MRQPILMDEKDDLLFKQELKKLEIEFWEPAVASVPMESLEILGDGHPNALASQLHYKFRTNHILSKHQTF